MRLRFFRFGNGQLPLSFALLILCGTLLMLLPGVLKSGEMSLIDAVFTSCSAVCLNGLSVIPASEFTFFGQLLLLLLIQVGCFGILSLSAMILLMLGRGLSFSNTLVMYNLNDRFSLGCTEELVRTIAGYTFISEAVGFLLMLPGFLLHGDFGVWESLWYALFYAVGSFCNAGIGPLPGDIADAGRYVQVISIMLIIFGGIGVYVIYDILEMFRDRRHRMRLHSRIVLWSTGILLIAGTLLLWSTSMLPSAETLDFWDALYLSESSRTAGYTTSEIGLLPQATVIIIMILMLIGGSPGGAAGGIKTTTLAVVFAALISSFKGDSEVIIGKRSIAWRIVLRAFTIVVIFLILSVAGALALNFLFPHKDSLRSAFEVVSALSGTGLSMGHFTGELNGAGKVLIILFMFIGRVGPLAIILFFVGREKSGHLRYPQERVIVG